MEQSLLARQTDTSEGPASEEKIFRVVLLKPGRKDDRVQTVSRDDQDLKYETISNYSGGSDPS